MDSNRNCKRIHILVLYVCIAAIYLTHCDARKSMVKHGKRSKLVVKHFDVVVPLDSSNTVPYGVNSPFSLPPFDSLAPIPLPENAPPFCINPPFTSQTPPTSIPTPSGSTPPSPPLPLLSPPFYYIPPILPIQSPPPSPTSIVPSPPEFSFSPNPPEINPTPPGIFPGQPAFEPSPPIYVPSPPGSMLSPPSYEPSPPSYVPSPPSYVPTPGGGFVPSPPVFQPPVVFPPPTVPPPPQRGPNLTLWCVAKPTVPDPIIEEAMNYACGSGADCESIQPNGSCYQPNTLFAHASYAFNSYWQRTKVAGGTCEFGGTAMLVTVDPSYDGCHFLYY